MPSVSAPPGLSSTMMVPPRMGAISAARMRATVSVALPAACGTIRRIGLSGYSANAVAGSAPIAQANTNAPNSRFMVILPTCSCRKPIRRRPIRQRALSAQPRRFVEHGTLGDTLVVGRGERGNRQRHGEIGEVIGRGDTVRALPGV